MHFIALGIIALSILWVIVSLLRERVAEARIARVGNAGASSVLLDPGAAPVILSDFDPDQEALLVQLPAGVVDDVSSEDFAFRESPDGEGQELLFRDQVFLCLPNVAPSRQIDIFVEPVAA
ncbi:MAG: hypothetical protein ACK5JR_21205 [Tropicimonas sp.]|uniref:hypothetical protein n=1 Tax=Tropicimonas sp. TaxID=2067044 RepID=UPI003A83D351